MSRKDIGASSNGRTADFGSAYEGSNPSAPARPPARAANRRAEVKSLPLPERFLLVPIGPVPKGLLPELTAALQEVFAAPSEVGTPLGKPDFAYNKDRHQYHSTAVLRRLVFGEADRESSTALVSVFRLKGADGQPVSPERFTHRSRVEAVHAMGHLLGLSHCSDFRCAMFLSHTPADSDRKGAGICTSCRTAVGRS
jgi:archaemetzincin